MTIMWFLTFIILLIIELTTVNLVTIWFAIGAVAGLITTMFTDSILIQLIVFVTVSLIALLLTKPLIKKFKGYDVVPTNSDRVIGKVGEVTKEIKTDKYGEVKVYGNIWTASSKDEIKVGEKVKVLAIDGVKLIVEKEEE